MKVATAAAVFALAVGASATAAAVAATGATDPRGDARLLISCMADKPGGGCGTAFYDRATRRIADATKNHPNVKTACRNAPASASRETLAWWTGYCKPTSKPGAHERWRDLGVIARALLAA
ncbi:hypothetical protein ACQEVF_56635 [Nonomuraea polychroma]|uniref:hypothetical protein n=1 Tax=Nonomuraea polychroma TaxID=46176 RepID=UPI003D942F49